MDQWVLNVNRLECRSNKEHMDSSAGKQNQHQPKEKHNNIFFCTHCTFQKPPPPTHTHTGESVWWTDGVLPPAELTKPRIYLWRTGEERQRPAQASGRHVFHLMHGRNRSVPDQDELYRPAARPDKCPNSQIIVVRLQDVKQQLNNTNMSRYVG